MSIQEEIQYVNKKMEDMTLALKRAIAVELDRVEEQGISGYDVEHDEKEHRFILYKKGNTARFVIDLERYIQATVFHTEAVEAFVMSSGGKNDYDVHMPLVELRKLHRSFTTEVQQFMDTFVVLVETECLGEAE